MIRCIFCNHKIQDPPVALTFPAVTSGSKSFQPTLLRHCVRCGHVEKIITSELLEFLNSLYAGDYITPATSSQISFCEDGKSISRNELRARYVFSIISEYCSPNRTIRLLDFGAGGGDFIRHLNRHAEGKVQSAAYEVSSHRQSFLKNAGVDEAYFGSIDNIEGKYDIITLFHVLEHLQHPVETIANLSKLLNPNGSIIVVVPNWQSANFDFYIAEHLHHFTEESLRRTLDNALLNVMNLPRAMLGDAEIGLLGLFDSKCYDANVYAFREALSYAERIPELINNDLQMRKDPGSIGVFGVGGAGLWLGAILDEKIDFFVDEDPSKWHHSFNEKPIFSVADAPRSSTVYITLNNHFQSEEKRRGLSLIRPDIVFIAF
jgi:SAM-dependent methyltransferase